MCSCQLTYFFFTSRRRHTRWPRDWSSDVCSSDLYNCNKLHISCDNISTNSIYINIIKHECYKMLFIIYACTTCCEQRSEERRVGKECGLRRERKRVNKKR